MQPRDPSQRLRFWSVPQRVVLIAFIFVVSAFLLIRLHFTSAYIPDPQPPQGSRASDLQDKLDPNTADWQTLAALPNLGENRAKQIVAYREEFRRTRPHKIPFQSPDDLLKVKGIGVSTVESLTPHLTFPATQPAP
jgi:DNA uptake protein ComE-like DNA-binding protein